MPTLINIGDALIKIRKNRLYRDRYSTFEEYCRDTFEYSKSHANRLIDAAHIVNVLTPIGVNRETIRESQIRPLVGLNEKEVKAAWTKANKSADGTKLTARHVRLAAAQFKTSAPKPQKKLSKSSKTSKPLPQILKLITKVEVAIQKQTLDDALDLLAKLRRVFTH